MKYTSFQSHEFVGVYLRILWVSVLMRNECAGYGWSCLFSVTRVSPSWVVVRRVAKMQWCRKWAHVIVCHSFTASKWRRFCGAKQETSPICAWGSYHLHLLRRIVNNCRASWNLFGLLNVEGVQMTKRLAVCCHCSMEQFKINLAAKNALFTNLVWTTSKHCKILFGLRCGFKLQL